MKMLFASDSFKGSLTAVEICDLLQEAAADISRMRKRCRCLLLTAAKARWMRCFAQWAENG